MTKRACVILVLFGLVPLFVKGHINLADVPCGHGATRIRNARVVGGQDAIPREFPWLVSITRKGGHWCGGTILNSKFILTAAHCFCSGYDKINFNQFKLTLGEYNLKEKESPVAKVETISKITMHPEFKCRFYINDVALVETTNSISWSESVQPACLPHETGKSGFDAFNGEEAVTAGWGWLGEDKSKDKRADVLQKVDVRVLENSVCNEWYASQEKKIRVVSGQMCAGYEDGGRDSCSADSGGPLMVGSHPARTMVVGVVSSGIGCARPRLPGIYTRVSEYIPWIVQQAIP
ncbi:trypsin-1-like [Leptopilina boulardi]|uniref:trypsin-1-like n=1 Tax=Leptopilina boulardi TaxID=63433 RepID=UPI0021F56B19|nr:trypsin-1-like [Leptopilina boulardi]